MRTILLAAMAIVSFTFVASAADATGTWSADIPGRGGNTTTTKFTFTVSGSTLSGTMDGGRGATPLTDGKVDGDTITFTQTIPGRDGGEPFKITYTGKVSADHIDFSRDAGRGAPVTFTAKKQ
jgi:hypothetical protein